MGQMPLGLVASQRAGWSPLDLPNLRLWAQSTEATVSAWPDKSGTASLSQATSGKQPSVANSINGLQVVTFDGTDDCMSTADPGSSPSQPWTMFAVIQPSSVTGNRNIIGNGSTVDGPCMFIGSNKLSLFANSVVAGASNVGTSPRIAAGCLDGASSWVRLDGGAVDGAGNAGASGFRGFTLGTYKSNNPNDFFAGDMGDVIVCNAALTDDQLDAAGGYLAARFGLTWTPVS